MDQTPDQTLQCYFDYHDDKLTLFHWVFESHSDATTVKVLCSDKMDICFRRTWTPFDFHVTGYCIAHSNCCNWSLNSDGGCIDDDKLELFSTGCHTTSASMDMHGCLLSVKFDANHITSEGIQHFVNIPQHIRQGIRDLLLNSNKLDARACDLLAKAIAEMTMLEELNLDYNPAIGNGGAVVLIRSLYTSRVKNLRLSATGIGKEDCVHLSELLKSSHHLEHLVIRDNDLSSESVEMITSGVTHSSSLTTLNMSHSQFSVLAMVNLASVLSEQCNCKLEEIVLWHCNITSEGMAVLAAALHKNSTLRSLKLDHNNIGPDGVAAIAQNLPRNRTLRELYLYNNPIGEEGVRQLVSSLEQNSSLDVIYLAQEYEYISGSNPRIKWR